MFKRAFLARNNTTYNKICTKMKTSLSKDITIKEKKRTEREYLKLIEKMYICCRVSTKNSS